MYYIVMLFLKLCFCLFIYVIHVMHVPVYLFVWSGLSMSRNFWKPNLISWFPIYFVQCMQMQCLSYSGNFERDACLNRFDFSTCIVLNKVVQFLIFIRDPSNEIYNFSYEKKLFLSYQMLVFLYLMGQLVFYSSSKNSFYAWFAS